MLTVAACDLRESEFCVDGVGACIMKALKCKPSV